MLDFLSDVQRLDAVVIDTRIKPHSRRPEWNKSRLLAALGTSHYLHVGELGNKNYQSDGPPAIVDLPAGLKKVVDLLDHGRPVILLCICADVRDCHRNLALDALRKLSWRVVEL